MVTGKYIYMILKYVSYRERVTDINSYLSLACNCAAKCLAWFAWSSLSRYAKLSETVSGFSTFLELCRRVRRRCALPSWNCALPESFGFEYLETFADSAKIPSKQQWRFQKCWPSDPSGATCNFASRGIFFLCFRRFWYHLSCVSRTRATFWGQAVEQLSTSHCTSWHELVIGPCWTH